MLTAPGMPELLCEWGLSLPCASLLNNSIHILNPMPQNGIFNYMLRNAILNPVLHY
jgi:hypothetical protein